MLGVCYYPEHWPESMWVDDAKEMHALGLTYVRIAEFAWSRIEPSEGQFDFTWLDRAIDTLAAEGLKIIMCTPTATPPRWLINKHPDMLAVDVQSNRTREFGSRRHYDFSSTSYRQAAMHISAVIAKRYGKHSAVAGWQTDNEIGCHDTTLSASPNAKRGFQHWCKQRYRDINSLNQAWGNVFWSMDYHDFCDIDVPYFSVTETNPSHQLAFRRYSSDQVVIFHQKMAETIRRHSPGRFVTHNFIPMSDTQCDNYALAKPLDFASFDNYPLGRTDLFFADEDEENFKRYMRTGHPDLSSYYFDQTRGLCQKNFWLMEQQPGPVNWAAHNPRPQAGMVNFWSWVAFAHGADAVCYFRWRQVPFAQEQMHAGLKRVDNSATAAFAEVKAVNTLLSDISIKPNDALPLEVAIVSSTTNQWVCEIQQQGQSFQHERIEFEYYSALRQLGLDIAFVSPDMPLSSYKLVVVPCMPMLSDKFMQNCKETSAVLVFGPGTGSKTDEFHIPANLAPGKLQALIDVQVLSVDTIRADIDEPLALLGQPALSNRWREELKVSASTSVIAEYADGTPAIVAQNKVVYAGTLTCPSGLQKLLEHAARRARVNTLRLPEDVRIARRGNYGFVFNCSASEKQVACVASKKFVKGNATVAPYSFSVFTLAD